MERFLFARLEVWLVLMIVLFTGLASAFWAWRMLSHDAFPMTQIRELKAAIVSRPEDERSLVQRLTPENIFQEKAHAASHDHTILPPEAYSPVTLSEDFAGDPVVWEDLRIATFDDEERYFLIYGSFVFPGTETNFGAVLVDTRGVLHRSWAIYPDEADYLYRGPDIGLAVTDEGVIATNTRGVLNATGWCGEDLWEAMWDPAAAKWRPEGSTEVSPWQGEYNGYDWHHDITYHDGRFFSFVGSRIATVDARTGAVEDEIDGIDVMLASWDAGLAFFDGALEIFPREDLTPQTAKTFLSGNPFHYNKVEVLTEEQAGAYPDFEAGDMLLTLRNINLVVVMRPETKEIVWWSYGLVSRPHDASFVEGGIEVFNNATFTLPSQPTIRRLNLDGRTYEDVFDLSDWGMRMRWRGNFERTGERLLALDSDAGRMVHGLTTDGSFLTVFDNGYDGVNLHLSNATELTPDQVARFDAQCS